MFVSVYNYEIVITSSNVKVGINMVTVMHIVVGKN